MTHDPAKTTNEWVRQTNKDLAVLKRRPNHGPMVTTLTTADRRNKLIDPNFRQNPEAYASGATINIGTYGFAMWKCSGVVNLDNNPRFENATLGWTVFGTGAAATRVTTQNHGSGTASMSVTQTGTTDSYLKKDYTVVVGKNYTASIWVYITATGTQFVVGRTIMLVDTGNTVSLGAAPVDQTKLNQWQKISITTTSPMATTTLGIRLYGYMSATSAMFFDDIMLTEGTVVYPSFSGADTDCSWSGTADASTCYNVPNLTAAIDYSYDVDPVFGQAVVVRNSRGRVSQIIERALMPSGTYTAFNDGTAQMRMYQNTTAPGSRPAWTTGSATLTTDGTDDIVVEFNNPGTDATTGIIQHARVFAGTTDFGFLLPNIGEELRDCYRYFWSMVNPSSNPYNIQVANASAFSTSVHYGTLRFPVEMRVAPYCSASGVGAFLVQYQGVSTPSTNILFDTLGVGSVRVVAGVGGTVTAGYSSWFELKPGFSIKFDARIR